MSARLALPLVAAAALLAGCSASGLDAKTSFACKAPDGVTCMSVSGVYETSRKNALPGQLLGAASTAPRVGTPDGAPATGAASGTDAWLAPRRATLTSGTPLRTAPRILRIWLAPYEDSEGDLRDQSHIYVTVDRGTWQIEHTRRAIQDRFAPIRAIPPAASSPASTGVRPSEGERPQPARPAEPAPVVPGVLSGTSGND